MADKAERVIRAYGREKRWHRIAILIFLGMFMAGCQLRASGFPPDTPVALTPVPTTSTATPGALSTLTPTTVPAPVATDPVVSGTLPIIPTTLADGSIVHFGYEVVNTFPHDPGAYTQGLAYEDGVFFEGTGLHGQSTLRRVDVVSGKVLQQVDLAAEYFGEGIVPWQDTVLQLTWRSQVGFVYDKDSFELLRTFEYDTEGWGLTSDGRQLIMSDGTSTLYFRDPQTLAETGRIEVTGADGPVLRLNELEFIEGYIFAHVWLADYIVIIDPGSGRVVGEVDLTGLLPAAAREQLVDPGNDVLNGVAVDVENGRLFVTGKRWPLIFEITLVPRAR